METFQEFPLSILFKLSSIVTSIKFNLKSIVQNERWHKRWANNTFHEQIYEYQLLQIKIYEATST